MPVPRFLFHNTRLPNLFLCFSKNAQRIRVAKKGAASQPRQLPTARFQDGYGPENPRRKSLGLLTCLWRQRTKDYTPCRLIPKFVWKNQLAQGEFQHRIFTEYY
jgi:hypothetical protein